MKRYGCIVVVALWTLPALAHADDLAPTGTLRAVFLASNPVQARIDPADATPRGPAPDITRALAERRKLAYRIAGIASVRAAMDALKAGEADIAFLAYEPERAREVDFSQTYVLAHNTYMVLASSPLSASAAVDRAGIRIGVGERDAADLYLSRTAKAATLRRNAAGTIAQGIAWLKAGEIEAYAANRQRLTAAAAQDPALRVLGDNFYSVQQAIAVAKGNPARVAILDRVIDELRSSGFLTASLARAGLAGVDVAPAGAPR